MAAGKNEDEGGEGEEKVSDEGFVADGGGVELAEAVAVGAAAHNHINKDGEDEGEEEEEAEGGAVPDGGARDQEQGGGNFREGKEIDENRDEGGGDGEAAQGIPGALGIEGFSQGGEDEGGG